MKIKHYIFASMAIAAMVGCSNDDEKINDEPVEAQEGFISLSINMPTQADAPRRLPTRAGDNDNDAQVNFDDGLASEYEVKNAWLLLFEGADAASATFSSAYDITPTWELDPSHQITTSAQIIQKVKGPGSTNNLYAFVVINKPTEMTFTLPTTEHKYYNMSISGTPFSGKFADLQKTIIASGITNSGANRIMMCNSPLSTVAGGVLGSDPTVTTWTLSEIDHSKVFATEAQAKANPATEVFVERLAVKVTMTKTATTTFKPKSGGIDYTYSIDGWKLDNTNTASYLARVVPNTFTIHCNTADAMPKDYYRFMGETKVAGYNYYRLYWAEDVNYGDDASNLALTTTALTSAGTTIDGAFGEEHPQYCFENTFTTKHQNWRNTTRVIIKTKLTPGGSNTVSDGTDGDDAGTFYVLNGETETIYLKSQLDNLFKAQILKSDALQQWFKENCTGTLTAANITTLTYAPDAKNRLKVSAIKIEEKGSYTVIAGKDDYTTAAIETPLINFVNTTAQIDKYSGGKSYYVVRIKHFGDILTPWTDTEHLGEPELTDYIYGVNPHADDTYDNNRYLGRYGVVRNNWYNIHVSGIKQLGKPYVPEIDNTDGDTPDDEVDSYIAVKINILSWAKRTQNEVL